MLNHIFLMLADDWGSYDASFRIRGLGRTPDVYTPNIDSLASSGVTFANYYVQPICTPTRASLLTGRYSIHTGSEHILFGAFEPSCLPTELPLMPLAFKQMGYQTHGLGKWHCGYVNDTCAPWGRGFDSYIGYMNGNEGYYSHGMGAHRDWHACGSAKAEVTQRTDLTSSNHSSPCDTCSPLYKGRYSTHVYAERAVDLVRGWRAGDAPLFTYMPWQAVHEPLEVPAEYLKPFAKIADRSRRVYAAMLYALDEAIGNVSTALVTTGLDATTVLVLSNDNGGMSGTYGMGCCQCGTSCGGLNYPYRGWKDSFWEGGFRGIGLVHSRLFDKSSSATVSFDPLLHVSDWYRTLISAATHGVGATARRTAARAIAPLLSKGPIDSVDQWAALVAAARGDPPPQPPPRTEILLAGIDIDKHGAAIRVGRYKLLVGSWGADLHCDLNVSGYSPAYPAPAASTGLGGEGGLYCMHLPGTTAAVSKRTTNVSGVTVEAAEAALVAKPPPWTEKVMGLYDVVADPREMNDLQHTRPDVVATLHARLIEWNRTTVPSIHLPADPKGKEMANETNCWAPWR